MQKNLNSTTKAYPLSFTSVPRHLDRAISRRWAEVKPLAIMRVSKVPASSRSPHDPKKPFRDSVLEVLEDQHRSLVLRLRRAGVEMRTIRRNNLDDPRLSFDERELLIEPYLKGKQNG